MKNAKYREPAVAGMFYPSNPAELINQMDSFFSHAPKFDLDGQIIGLVVPHAGYIYSGLTAAVAYNLLKGKTIKTVVVISPSHREFFKGVSVYEGDGYATPLGILEVDEDLKNEILAAGAPFIASLHGHGGEHALEVQLPFLQRTLKDFKILPLVMGDQSIDICQKVAQTLFDVLKDRENYLIVASSDLSHYYKAEDAKRMDNKVIDDINNFNPDKLLEHLIQHSAEACGGGPISSMMKAARKLGANKSKVLHYSDSGDTSGDKNEVVGYLSAAVWKSAE
jgi:MEMO1 family protein